MKGLRETVLLIIDDRIRNGMLVWRYRLTRPGRLPKPIVIKAFLLIEKALEKVSILQR